MTAAMNIAKTGAAMIEWVIPRWYLRENSGPKKETMRSMSGNIAPIKKAIVAIFPSLCEKPVFEPRMPISP